MNPLRSILIVILMSGFMAVLQGCGDSKVDSLSAQAEQSRKHAADLESQLAKANEALARQQDENGKLVTQMDSLRHKVREMEAQALKKAETARLEKKEAPDVGKIGLLGAKAVAEFKAEQLSKRLDKLSADLDRKEQELAKINQLAKQKDAEVIKLRESVEKLQASDKTRVGDLQARLDSISKELEQRSTAATRSEQDLKEKAELLATLKNAVTDATKLKASAEAEAAKVRAELAQATKQLETIKAQTAAESQDLQDCAAWAEKADKELKQQQAALKQYRDEADRFRKESDQLKSALAELNNRIKAAAEATEEQESTIDKILEPPSVGAAAGKHSSNLY